MKPISILLVDDHALMRDTLSRRLADESDMNVTGSAGNASDALALAATQKPDVILMDIDMPGMTCFEAVRSIQSSSPGTRVIFLSSFFHDHYIEQAIAVSAWGYLVKTEGADAVVAAIRKVMSGITCFSPEVQQRLVVDGHAVRLAQPPTSRLSALSDREVEVLRYLARGMAKKVIGQTMGISAHTVHRHVASIMGKVDIHDRVELARYAIREGLAEA